MKQTGPCKILKAVIKKMKFSVNNKYALFTVEVSQIEIKSSLGHQG
jgi:hypothetical protein